MKKAASHPVISIIIFGTRGVTSTLAEGNFSCPQCANNQSYRHRKVRRFFTLYFIPVIPLDNLGEYVECGSCKNTFVTRVLNSAGGKQGETFEAEYQKAMKKVLILMMLADGKVEESEKAMLKTIMLKVGKVEISDAELGSEIGHVRNEKKTAKEYLKGIGPSLNDPGKEMVIRACYMMAMADGNIDPAEVRLIVDLGTAMEMQTVHVKNILMQMTSKN